MKKCYKIEVDCAACANKMEIAAAKVTGVQSAAINFLLQKMTVEFTEGSVPETVMADVLKTCRRIEPDCAIEF